MKVAWIVDLLLYVVFLCVSMFADNGFILIPPCPGFVFLARNGTFCAKIPVWLNVVQRAKEICIAEPAGISTLVKIPLEENRIVTCPDIEDFRHLNRNFSVQWFHVS